MRQNERQKSMATEVTLKSAENTEDLITIEESEYSNDYWLSRPYISKELNVELKKANVLLIPHEKFRDFEEPVFNAGSDELLQFIKEHKNDAIIPEICIEDEDYRELSLHSVSIVLGKFIVSSIISGVFINLVSEYLKKVLFDDKDADKAEVSFEMHVIEPGKITKRIRYKGPEKTFKEVVGKSLNLPIPTKPETKNINGPKKS